MPHQRGQLLLAPVLVGGLVEAVELLGILERSLGLLGDQGPLDQVGEHALGYHVEFVPAQAVTGIAINELLLDVRTRS